MDSHVNQLTKACFFHIRSLHHIRSSLSVDIAKVLACSLISSRLDYANAILYGMSEKDITKLQRIQNSLARVIVEAPRTEHVTGHLKNLHWLPIRYRIEFKIAVLTYNCPTNSAPSYLTNLLTEHCPRQALRSSSVRWLEAPFIKTQFRARGFRAAAPKIWNDLPDNVCQSSSLVLFKQNLKTFLFQCAFDN